MDWIGAGVIPFLMWYVYELKGGNIFACYLVFHSVLFGSSTLLIVKKSRLIRYAMKPSAFLLRVLKAFAIMQCW